MSETYPYLSPSETAAINALAAYCKDRGATDQEQQVAVDAMLLTYWGRAALRHLTGRDITDWTAGRTCTIIAELLLECGGEEPRLN